MNRQQYWAGIATRPGTRQRRGWANLPGHKRGRRNMSDSGRRDALRFLGAGALLGSLGYSLPISARVSPADVKAPQGRYFLSRLIERELVDDALLTVERRWSCQFQEAGRGMRAIGEALDCLVDAPAALAPLAKLEKEREDKGPFPALLDSKGLIATPSQQAPVDQRRVVDAAMSVLEDASITAGDLAQARTMLARMASAAGQSLSAIPQDLFFPDTTPQRIIRTVEVAPGVAGQIELEVVTLVEPGNGLLAMRERRLATSIGDDRRTAREVWTLATA